LVFPLIFDSLKVFLADEAGFLRTLADFLDGAGFAGAAEAGPFRV
jgi:hypothetical protein